MLKTILKSPWAGAVGVMIGWLWEAACLIGPPIGIAQSDKPKYLFWGLVAMLICSIQAFGTLLQRNTKLSGELLQIDEAKPKIRPKIPGSVHEKPVWHEFKDKDGNTVYPSAVPFLRITFWNDPSNPFPKAVGKGVRAYIKFFPEGYSVASLTIPGRWVGSDQASKYSALESKEHLLETAFGFGQEHIVDIAYISGIDGNCYAWNNDNYEYPGFQKPEHLLSAIGYRVTVRLWGEYFDKTFEFSFWKKDGKFNFTQPSP
jgi:hypothetical protein